MRHERPHKLLTDCCETEVLTHDMANGDDESVIDANQRSSQIRLLRSCLPSAVCHVLVYSVRLLLV